MSGARMTSGRRTMRLRTAMAVATLLAVSGGAAFLSGCASVPRTGTTERPVQETGIASYYARSLEGRRTANGERYDQQALTAAHRTLPFGTRVRVTNLDNGRSVVVRINDRGPHVEKRVIDLSYAAAQELKFIKKGTTKVSLEVLGRGADEHR